MKPQKLIINERIEGFNSSDIEKNIYDVILFLKQKQANFMGIVPGDQSTKHCYTNISILNKTSYDIDDGQYDNWAFWGDREETDKELKKRLQRNKKEKLIQENKKKRHREYIEQQARKLKII